MNTASWNTDPRVPGGTYLCGYWQQTYTVEAMWTAVDDPTLWLRVRWDDNRVTAHCTSWDGRADTILTVPQYAVLA